MTSTTSSYSEGEVLTSESEKASQLRPTRNDKSVDRPLRTNAAAIRNSRSRSRSRSPYRASKNASRRRDGLQIGNVAEPNSRPGRVRYDQDGRHSDRGWGRIPPVKLASRGSNSSHRSYEYDQGRRRPSKRPRPHSRSRSRSPYRHAEMDNQRQASKRRKEQLVSERGQLPSFAHSSGPYAKISEVHSAHAEARDRHVPFADEYVSAPAFPNGANATCSLAQENLDSETIAQAEVIDEAKLIEERRKRREALKAKYRDPETAVTTPQDLADTSLDSAKPDLSRTSKVDEKDEVPMSTGQSNAQTLGFATTEVSSQQNEASGDLNSASLPADDEECFAADYDPTADMEDERARHDKKLFNEDVSMSAEHERAVLEQGKLSVTQNGGDSGKPERDAFDMFAEDDDDIDMFGEAQPPTAKPSSVDAKTAQLLDVKLMDNWDDAEGYYVTIPGELFESRYHVLQNLGRGMFASVVRATDTKTDKLAAIKIVRNNDTMRKAGLKEIEILKVLAEHDTEDRKHVVRLERSFEHKGHLCMVFENMSLNLREVLKKFGRDVGINVKAIRAYAQQLFLGLSHMRKCQYLHADLKPDNILVNEARSVLKICDLGSASSIDENATAPYLVSRFYRAPEIILGIPYDYGIDVWSVGCTLFELYTGKILFTGRNNNSMLRSIMECRGKFPHKVLRKGSLTYQYFDDLLNFRAIEEDKLTGRTVTKLIDVKAKPVRSLRERLVPRDRRTWDEQERKEVELFVDLLDKCLDLRGDKRITPIDALKHPFIARGKT